MMLRSETILQELKEHSPGLIQISNERVYTVPPLYFEQFYHQLFTKIQAMEEEIQLPAPRNPYKVPEGYFQSLSKEVFNKISQLSNMPTQSVWEELEEIAPTLNQISKKPVYSIPQNYFEKIQYIPNTQTSSKAKSKVISFSVTRKWITYAAAAIMAGVLVTGALWNNASLTNSTIGFSLNKEITNVSDEAIQNYLNNDVTAAQNINDTSGIDSNASSPDLQQDLQGISDEELSSYLQSMDESTNVPVAAETKQNSGS